MLCDIYTASASTTANNDSTPHPRLVVVGALVDVVRHQLLVVAEAHGHHVLKEVDELDGVGAIGEVEIQTLVLALDAAVVGRGVWDAM